MTSETADKVDGPMSFHESNCWFISYKARGAKKVIVKLKMFEIFNCH